MTTTTTTTETLARVLDLEGQLATAQTESIRAQALAIALPGRIAAGDTEVTAAELIHAGPVVAIAKAKVTHLANQLAVAKEAHERAHNAELVAQLRAGKPFISPDQVEKEVARISSLLTKELVKFGNRIQAHNAALESVMEGVSRGDSRTFETDGAHLTIEHGRNGPTIELDGMEFFDLPADGWSREVSERVEMVEAIARDAGRQPVFMTGFDGEGLDADTIAGMVAELTAA